jgi:hypothetical protein
MRACCWRPHGRFDDVDTLCAEDLVELACELAVAAPIRNRRLRTPPSSSRSATATYASAHHDAKANPNFRHRQARFVKEAKRFQDLLGEHQDALVTRRHLRRLARTAGSGDAGVVAGRLIQVQEHQLAETKRAVHKAWKRLIKHGRRAWST